METIYCPVCRKEIEASAEVCPACGAITTTQGRMAIAQEQETARKKAEYLAAAEAQRQKEEQISAKEAERAASAEVHRQGIYDKATGNGVCPSCKSPNVSLYTFTEGQNNAGAGLSCCLGCFLTPLAWLALPFMSGKKQKGCICNYCSHRWRL